MLCLLLVPKRKFTAKYLCLLTIFIKCLHTSVIFYHKHSVCKTFCYSLTFLKSLLCFTNKKFPNITKGNFNLNKNFVLCFWGFEPFNRLLFFPWISQIQIIKLLSLMFPFLFDILILHKGICSQYLSIIYIFFFNFLFFILKRNLINLKFLKAKHFYIS